MQTSQGSLLSVEYDVGLNHLGDQTLLFKFSLAPGPRVEATLVLMPFNFNKVGTFEPGFLKKQTNPSCRPAANPYAMNGNTSWEPWTS